MDTIQECAVPAAGQSSRPLQVGGTSPTASILGPLEDDIGVNLDVPNNAPLHPIFDLATVSASGLHAIFAILGGISIPLFHAVLLCLPTYYEARFPWLNVTVRPVDESAPSWDEFCNGIISGYKVKGVFSGVLVTIISALLQFSNGATSPSVRMIATIAIITSLISCVLNTTYIVHMMGLKGGVQWLEDVEKMASSPWMNITVLLAAPAAWLVWAVIWTAVLILSIIWEGVPPASNGDGLALPLAVRVVTTSVLFLGILHSVVIGMTFLSLGVGRTTTVATVDGSLSELELGDVVDE
ncbi:hypothetical protein B0H21DRAFT_520217 [Amylocystis lapponica]|nr:hypothetical protein B0H21DRAFT_520217 [Amylocystis lapponica]